MFTEHQKQYIASIGKAAAEQIIMSDPEFYRKIENRRILYAQLAAGLFNLAPSQHDLANIAQVALFSHYGVGPCESEEK